MEVTGRLWDVMESDRKGGKVTEGNGKPWNLMEVSGKYKNIPWVSYVSEERSGLELSTKRGEVDYVSGRQSMTVTAEGVSGGYEKFVGLTPRS